MPAASIVPLPAEDARIAVIGLGYVGLPLAVTFGAVRPVVGFDIDARRVAELAGGADRTLVLDAGENGAAAHLRFSSDPADLDGGERQRGRIWTHLVDERPCDRYAAHDARHTRGQVKEIAASGLAMGFACCLVFAHG